VAALSSVTGLEFADAKTCFGEEGLHKRDLLQFAKAGVSDNNSQQRLACRQVQMVSEMDVEVP